jgi:hypothetical protein
MPAELWWLEKNQGTQKYNRNIAYQMLGEIAQGNGVISNVKNLKSFQKAFNQEKAELGFKIHIQVTQDHTKFIAFQVNINPETGKGSRPPNFVTVNKPVIYGELEHWSYYEYLDGLDGEYEPDRESDGDSDGSPDR